ncbi:CMP-N-acetylneuraminic acid synthetase [Succinivibrio dextrinosolvens]|uniref:cytidylyltransferase domain-containing protein n=1 Tax=Succinivibrio dextrinosolvens TaxID=83771 RepID=UPI0008EEE31F|nr:glycosyltransferase [Succinivibrio dextrinosolvens]SFS46058.1 CMP-N-acetylneuraminic acid synthetase [Succinivibrio dextrinosolvens]
MKILAVIPARAGSKGIPNKNLRIIGARPLIYYSINNAIKSTYITDIVVSTDSTEVGLIAKQMGVKVHKRNNELCKDNVTLDPVIFDAIDKKENWDYIITLQPTSPTLSISTLDKAIQFAIEKKLDTLISAVNKPHLSWKEDQGNKIPNYEKRLNRQQLPANYVETGAFVISRADIVTKNTRIGRRTEIYELPEKEALDIDSFPDLLVAEYLLNLKKVAIYVNGNKQRGLGHVYRALEIADEFYTPPDIYFDINQTDPSIFGQTKHSLIPVNGITDLFKRAEKEKYDIFINDILSTSIDYMIALRKILPKSKIVNFEDIGEGVNIADLVINALYEDNLINSPKIKTGENYYICGKPFLFYPPIKIKKSVKKIFISFGGADPQNYTDTLLQIISKEDYRNYKFTVVLGKSKNNVCELLSFNRLSNIKVIYDVNNMPELMSECDIGITSRGRTAFELALLGIPLIVIAQNQKEETHNFERIENGFNYLGMKPDQDLIESNLKMYLSLSYESRISLQNKLLSHDLRNGRKKVMSLINSI